MAEYFENFAPFLSKNWKIILVALLAIFLSRLLKIFTNGGRKSGEPAGNEEKGDDEVNATESVQAEVREEDETELLHVLYAPTRRLNSAQMVEESKRFYELMRTRRSLRFFSSDDVPLAAIENIVRTAGSAPSGANQQPWTFVVVREAEVKRKIREIVEEEEEVNYRKRMGEKWVEDLKPLKTSWEKPYLQEAPYVVVVFERRYGVTKTGERQPHYYAEISASIACGLFVTAVHASGLVTVTTTPLNAGPKLRLLLGRPQEEKVLLLLPVGLPAEGATVPDLTKKPLNEIMVTI